MFFKKLAQHMRDYWVLHLMALPAVAVVFMFSYLPKFGVIVAFQKQLDSLFGVKGIWFAVRMIGRNPLCFSCAKITLPSINTHVLTTGQTSAAATTAT